jgi:hypothetical protein
LFKVVSYKINPVAGEAMAFFCTVVIRGGRKPFVVESDCSIALALTPVAEAMPTPREAPALASPKATIKLVVDRAIAGNEEVEPPNCNLSKVVVDALN